LWHITEFGVNASTSYAAQDTNYQTFYLKDASGNTIASVANGPSSGGLAIGPTVVTGVDTAMDGSYDDIDCSSANKTVYVSTAATGNGRAMVKIMGWIKAVPYRP
jgi:urocanate hydratase